VNLSGISFLSKLWLGGRGQIYPTLHLPIDVARQYKLDKPCKITIEGRDDLGGILIKHLCPKKEEEQEQEKEQEKREDEPGDL
jgi:hypothetical protein